MGASAINPSAAPPTAPLIFPNFLRDNSLSIKSFPFFPAGSFPSPSVNLSTAYPRGAATAAFSAAFPTFKSFALSSEDQTQLFSLS